MNARKLFFPNLNGLRFFAALVVIVHHLEEYKEIFGLPNYYQKFAFIRFFGPLGVILFFVLSGFLITYLLMAEEQQFGRVHIGKFYLRRVLRIWPLYYLILLLAFAVLPLIDAMLWPGFGPEVIYASWGLKLILYAFFLPNFVESTLGNVPYVSHFWSIGTEEQYYLIWPLIFRYLPKFRMAILISLVCIQPIIGNFLVSKYSAGIPYHATLSSFWSTFNMNCMGIGSILGILLHRRSRIMDWILRTDLFLASIVLVVVLVAWGGHIPYFHYEVYALLFGIIIVNFAANKRQPISLNQPWLHYLGKISFGLYMIHPICVVITIRLSLALGIQSLWLTLPLTLGMTIVLAAISYHYYESWFLRRKERFALVKSGGN